MSSDERKRRIQQPEASLTDITTTSVDTNNGGTSSGGNTIGIDLGCYHLAKDLQLRADALIYDAIVRDGGECQTVLVPLVTCVDTKSSIHKSLDQLHKSADTRGSVIAGKYISKITELKALNAATLSTHTTNIHTHTHT
eukprot:GHVR01156477.1.p1 GENE.GHVR01156477.1~~GHVR01156477.1.p1  ORF type:complete len:139 (+),score=52.45 GHVR01156477.1:106-522(+)